MDPKNMNLVPMGVKDAFMRGNELTLSRSVR